MKSYLPDVWLPQGLDEVFMALHVTRRMIAAVAKHSTLYPHAHELATSDHTDAEHWHAANCIRGFFYNTLIDPLRDTCFLLENRQGTDATPAE
jgi:hypothetical protein